VKGVSKYGLTMVVLAALLRMPAGPGKHASALTEHRRGGLPRVILWAWERPEDLSFIDPRKAGVAYLARTLYLEGDRVLVRPRLNPLIVSPTAIVIPVVRIEIVGDSPPTLSTQQRERAVRAIAELASSAPAEIQIDFDATRSERGFYRALLTELRARIPRSIALSITALASWCIYDDWIANLPVDEAVPMLFSMGADSEEVAAYLRRGGGFAPLICQGSIGVAIDEPIVTAPASRRAYVFSARAWTRAKVVQAIAEVTK
jgi:Protein of unknown function (DUF3142)